jgi:NAD(P)-dependent dehydrogenase (short-subunit alcohol dehydrogenase family)
MTIADRAVLVTGANRGIGQALVEEALRRGRSGCMPVRASLWPTRTRASRP